MNLPPATVTGGRRGRFLRACIRRAAAAMLIGCATLLGAGAATADTLVSNLGKSASGFTGLTNHDKAQPFTTGENGAGYGLTSIKIKFRTSSGTLKIPSGSDTFKVRVVDGLTSTSTTVATLTNPGTWTETSTFSAPTGTSLDANTTYYLIIEGSGGRTRHFACRRHGQWRSGRLEHPGQGQAPKPDPNERA